MAFYKFLRAGDGPPRGPFSDMAWPVPDGAGPGPWMEVAPPLELCRRGIHVCRPGDLPHWLAGLLWEVEVAGQVVEDDDKVVVERARLVAPVPGWPEQAGPFAEDCVLALRDHVVAAARGAGLDAEAGRLAGCTSASAVPDALAPLRAATVREVVDLAGYLDDAVTYAGMGETAIVAFVAAHAAERAPRPSGARLPRGMTGFDVERRRQADWLAARLNLS